MSALGGGMGGAGQQPVMVPPGGPPPSSDPSRRPELGVAGIGGGLLFPNTAPPDGLGAKDSAGLPASQKSAEQKGAAGPGDTLAEVGREGKDGLDVLMPISIPADEEDRPLPRQVKCLEDGTNLFVMFGVDKIRFEPKDARRAFHRMS